jgi:hypothetical protein
MGVTYDELSVFGRLRKVDKCGPYSTFTKLVHEWGSFLSPLEVRVHYYTLDLSHTHDNAAIRLQRKSSISFSNTPETATR